MIINENEELEGEQIYGDITTPTIIRQQRAEQDEQTLQAILDGEITRW